MIGGDGPLFRDLGGVSKVAFPPYQARQISEAYLRKIIRCRDFETNATCGWLVLAKGDVLIRNVATKDTISSLPSLALTPPRAPNTEIWTLWLVR